jgi:hypothetical protein
MWRTGLASPIAEGGDVPLGHRWGNCRADLHSPGNLCAQGDAHSLKGPFHARG